MTTYSYHIVDVFTDKPFGGNPLAVFTDGANVPPELMPLLAKELNLSETTFVLPPTNPANNYRVRIFTPAIEMLMAGHPTVGTAYVLGKLGLIPRQGNPTSAVFEEKMGDIPLKLEYSNDSTTPHMVWMTQSKPTYGPMLDDLQMVADILSLPVEAIDRRYPVQIVSTGVPFAYIPLQSLADIKSIRLDGQACKALTDQYGLNGIFVFTQEVETAGSTVHSRMFAPGLGVQEDAATGSASGPLGAYLAKYGIAPVSSHMISEQGLEMGRPSYIHIELDRANGEISAARIAGQCYYMGQGQFDL